MDKEIETFVRELIAPFSIHRAKYKIPHGTVARKQFANRAKKRLDYFINQEVDKRLRAERKKMGRI